MELKVAACTFSYFSPLIEKKFLKRESMLSKYICPSKKSRAIRE